MNESSHFQITWPDFVRHSVRSESFFFSSLFFNGNFGKFNSKAEVPEKTFLLRTFFFLFKPSFVFHFRLIFRSITKRSRMSVNFHLDLTYFALICRLCQSKTLKDNILLGNLWSCHATVKSLRPTTSYTTRFTAHVSTLSEHNEVSRINLVQNMLSSSYWSYVLEIAKGLRF